MLLGDADDPGLADYVSDLNQILAAGQQLLEIINDLLDPNQLASGDVVFNLESLVANLHYQVRIPLNSIIGFSEILLENAAEQGLVDSYRRPEEDSLCRRTLPLPGQRNCRFFQD